MKCYNKIHSFSEIGIVMQTFNTAQKMKLSVKDFFRGCE